MTTTDFSVFRSFILLFGITTVFLCGESYAWSFDSRGSSRVQTISHVDDGQVTWLPPSRRQVLGWVASVPLYGVLMQPQKSVAYTPDPDKLQESLYLISRVQEATVQQQRFVNRSKLQEDLRNKMKLTLKLVEKNYRLIDQITFCAGFVPSQEDLVPASEAGYEAVDALQSAIDYVRDDLKSGPLTDAQKQFLNDALTTTREELFDFLKYMPQDKLLNARARVEDENVKNRDEFDGDDDAGVYNPVVLPWKNR